MQNNETIGSINTSAMQKGACLGLFGIASLVVFKWSFTLPLLSSLFTLMVLASPVLAALLTMRYRNESTEKFDFMKGFLHTLFMGFYAFGGNVFRAHDSARRDGANLRGQSVRSGRHRSRPATPSRCLPRHGNGGSR